MKYGKIYTYENRNEAEIGKKYVFSDYYQYVFDEAIAALKFHSELKAVRNDRDPFETENGARFQFIREVIEEEPALMTNRQLAEWLAKGNGQMKFEEPFACTKEPYAYPYHIYNLEKENDAVKGFVRIIRWGSDEWVVPTVDIYERDCR